MIYVTMQYAVKYNQRMNASGYQDSTREADHLEYYRNKDLL